jgi:hypothetical protein
MKKYLASSLVGQGELRCAESAAARACVLHTGSSAPLRPVPPRIANQCHNLSRACFDR